MKRTDEKTAIAQRLKEMIEENGLDYLKENPFEIYSLLLDEKVASPLSIRMILLTLLAQVHLKAKELADPKAIARYIQRSCCLNKVMADFLSSIYAEVFSAENQEEWEKKAGMGFDDFCRQEWKFSWNGDSVWRCRGGSMDCFCGATAAIKIVDTQQVGNELKKMLEKNPFMASDEIFGHYQSMLCELLDSDFEEYCTAEDYYPPVVEDYAGNFDDIVNEFCKKHGMELIASDYSGELSDFEPDDRY